MATLAGAVLDLQREIPPEINWVLRVDGHTDNVPLSGTGRFRDNWELSAARAISVVKFLVSQGVPAERLVAAVPVGPPGVSTTLTDADEVVCAVVPRRFEAVGQVYADFGQVDDDVVRDLLRTASA